MQWNPSIRTLWNKDTLIKGTVVAARHLYSIRHLTKQDTWNSPKVRVQIRGVPLYTEQKLSPVNGYTYHGDSTGSSFQSLFLQRMSATWEEYLMNIGEYVANLAV